MARKESLDIARSPLGRALASLNTISELETPAQDFDASSQIQEEFCSEGQRGLRGRVPPRPKSPADVGPFQSSLPFRTVLMFKPDG